MKPITIGSLFSGIGGLGSRNRARPIRLLAWLLSTIWQVEQSDVLPPHPEPSLAPR